MESKNKFQVMIQAVVFKLQDSGWQCNHPECEHNPKYHNNIIGDVFHLKQDETVLKITLSDMCAFYCRECIDKVYKKLKPVLDSNLWPFK